ncbi:uncharacterized protein SEPMUDRAFT_147256 [Sphaerulina musiva SO2202]|uniref:Uncharacterized protein n=1 Tax=Sphaerulina musiva (strain SO2202) TaxID=692275 RepID=M3C4Y2_SPHMS|nr:uncharacterized protein SEPMUDRAFT_147256 [Sphaerulina musiva SO2202]EMF15346.1 hypothetical protein SEPMUDRAFT_147256 [Sphaerulina musiva SO2202]
MAVDGCLRQSLSPVTNVQDASTAAAYARSFGELRDYSMASIQIPVKNWRQQTNDKSSSGSLTVPGVSRYCSSMRRGVAELATVRQLP